MFNKKQLCAFSGLIVNSLLLTTANAVSLYELTDLGPLYITDQEAQSLRIKINNSGRIVAWSHRGVNASSNMAGFYAEGSATLAPPLADASNHQFNAISNSHDIVGFVGNGNNRSATLWNSNFTAATSLGNLGGSWSIATAINSKGDVVGQSENAGKTAQAFIFSSGSINPVISGSSLSSSAEDISDSNWIVGNVYENGNTQAFVFDTNTVTQLSQLDSRIYGSWASSINNLNQLVGGMIFSTDGTGSPRYIRTYAYRWSSADGIVNLGEKIAGISWAIANNDSGQVVGGRLYNLLERQAILWEGDVGYNLNQLTQNKLNWQLLDATDVNESGSIVGIGRYLNNSYRAFLLKPSVSGIALADLQINIVRPTARGKSGSRSTDINLPQRILLQVSNQGPADASNVVVETKTDMPLTLADIVSQQATCSLLDSLVRCEIAQLAVDASAEVAINLGNAPAGEFDLDASVAANQIDAGPNTDNAVSEKLVISKSALAPVVIDDQSVTAGSNSTTSATDSVATEPTESGAVDQADDALSAKSASGCSMGSSSVTDPMLWLLCVAAILGIGRKYKHTIFTRRN